MSNLTDYAKSELECAGWFDKDSAYGGMIGPVVMKMIEAFAAEGHSGGSATIAIGIFAKLAAYEPLTPLTGEDSEWMKASDNIFQNKRCYTVFKTAAGCAYDITGKIFREPSGVCFSGKGSHVDVTFPYTPTTEYVDVPEKNRES